MADQSTTDKITGWYQQYLGRAPEAGAVDGWANAMNQGSDAQAYIQTSPEAQAYNAKQAVSSATSPWVAALSSSTSAPSQIDPNSLATRTIDPKTETVNGQMQTILGQDSPLLQQARSDAMRSAAERGLQNSTMSASGGEDAVIRSALNIATPDAGYYNQAANYNAAATNQATMWNHDQQNQFALQKNQQASQIVQNTENYKQQASNNNMSIVNSILNNTEMSPDRKAALLESMGKGTSARKNPDGSVTPGTGMAGAVYVIDSVTADLSPQYSPYETSPFYNIDHGGE